MSAHNPTHTPSAEVIARENHVLELRRAGLSFERIAQEIGIGDRSTAHKIYKRALGRVHQEPAAEIRQLEGDRLDRLQVAVWTKALAGNMQAVDRVLRIMERRAKLLGLDHADGIAERQLQLEADKIRLVAVAFGRALDALDLTAEQRETAARILLSGLRGDAGGDGSGDDPDQALGGGAA